jgi:hypothetical protein
VIKLHFLSCAETMRGKIIEYAQTDQRFRSYSTSTMAACGSMTLPLLAGPVGASGWGLPAQMTSGMATTGFGMAAPGGWASSTGFGGTALKPRH